MNPDAAEGAHCDADDGSLQQRDGATATAQTTADAIADDGGMAALADALRRRIVPWMATQPRGHWRVVQLALERRGLIEPSLSPEAFACRLTAAVPEVGDPRSLGRAMRRYKLTERMDAARVSRLPEGAPLLLAVRYAEQRL